MSPDVTNPLLQAWTTPYQLPPFDAIRAEHFEPAFAHAFGLHRAELDALAGNPAAADFANTVQAFDASGRLLTRLEHVFFNLTASQTSPDLQAAQRALAQPLAAHNNAVYMHGGVFARVDALYAVHDTLGLDAQQRRLLERVHLDFVRAGARLQGDAQARYAKVMERLAELTTRFAQNVLADESAFRLVLRDEVELAGLPDFVRASSRQAALDRDVVDAHVITLSRSLLVPFLTFSERADLRQQAWAAWVGRGESTGESDNRDIVVEILALRGEQAALHGYACYADYALADTMAGRQDAVQALLSNVWERAVTAVERERAQLQALRDEEGVAGAIEAWDWRYWAEKVRQRSYAIDDAEVKPYFSLPRMVEAAFDCAQRLFGVRFVERSDLPVYHPDVKAYEVLGEGDQVIGVFLQDNFARATKRSGAWMSALRWQSQLDGAVLPVILNNNNFAKGALGEPTLLSFDDARTLFHEFGHGLHGLLSQVRFERLSGTQVLRDFVELPSQMFEHWLSEPEVLHRHARHFATGEAIPSALVKRIQAARRFGQGYETVRYTASALVDMAAHALPQGSTPTDAVAFEAEVLAAKGLPTGVGLNHRLVHFQTCSPAPATRRATTSTCGPRC